MNTRPELPIPPEKDFRSAVEPNAQKHRAMCALDRSISKWVYPVAIVCVLLGMYKPARIMAVAGFIICGVILAFMGARIPKLKCPACKKNVGKSLGRYCPECGVQAVRVPRFPSFAVSKCETCGKELRSGGMGGRYYRVRYCTVLWRTS